MTYSYTFVAVPAALGTSRPNRPTYRDVIQAYARQGWRFVQLVVENTAAVPGEYVLIFERPAES